MAETQLSYGSDVFPVAFDWASNVFATHPEKETLINDVLSVAWEDWQNAPEGVRIESIVWYAIKQVASNRQFGRSKRSIDSPIARRQRNVESSGFDLLSIARDSANPATVVAFRVDFRDWFASLSDRERQIVTLLGMGESTGEVALIMRLSAGRISQFRRTLERSWKAFRYRS